MPYDMVKPTGSLKHAKSETGGNTKNTPVIGVVKDNIDPTRSGRIRVSLVNGTGSTDPNDSGGWVTVQYLSTFFGAVGSTSGSDSEDHGTYKTNPSSYGQWQAPPDIGTKVVCIFINGDPNYGFYIGAIPEPEKLQMVPAIGASDKVTLNSGEAGNYGGATRLPVTNLNTNNKDKADSAQFLETPRPVHSYTASIMNQQGIIRDPVRGPISSSASREPSSRVGWGVSTPGRPIYTGGYDDTNLPNNLDQSKSEQLQVVARRGGHSIVMDDGDIIGRDQLIRIRTSLGHQILMSDDGQTLMILHSNGQSYIELGKEGTVDIFSTNSFNVRTQGDINFHADQNINIHAMENINIQAKNIQTNSEETTKSRAGTDYQINALSNFTVKAGSAAAIAAGGEASMVAGGPAFVNGSKVNLNSGSPGTSPAEVPIITLIAQTDTLFDSKVGWAAAPGKLMTIASRAPAHAPWANAGQGISIKTSPDAADNLPPSPSTAVQQANQAGAAAGATPPATATVASAPVTTPVSGSVNAGTTGAVLGATATAAATGATAPAVQGGAAIIDAASNPASGGKTATIAAGAFGQTAEQLAGSGVLKPGAATLINGLVSAGTDLFNAVSDTLFTGMSGAESLTALATNVEAQATSVVATMQKAQTALTNIGVISGKEDPSQTAGLVTAAAVTGVSNTVNAVKTASAIAGSASTQIDNTVTSLTNTTVGAVTPATNVVNQFQSATNAISSAGNTASSALSAIGAGSAAAGLASTLGGLGGIANSVNALLGEAGKLSLSSLTSSVNGIAASAFNSIKDAFPKLEANIPQFLSKSAKDAAGKTAAIAAKPATQTGSSSLSSLVKTATSTVKTVNSTLNTVNTALKTIGSGTNTLENTVTGITGTVNAGISAINTVSQTTSTFTSVATSVNSAGSDLTNLVNKTSGAFQSIDGAVKNAMSQVSGLAGAAQALTSGGLSELAKAAKSVQTGGGAAQASALASGIINLPGGIKAVSSVVDKSLAKANIPGASSLTGVLNDAQTAVQNGLTTASNALKDVNGAISSITGSASQMSGSINSISTSASGAISSASGTVSSVTNSLTSAAGTVNNIAGSVTSATGSLTNAATGITNALGDAANKLNGITSAVTSALGTGDASALMTSLSALSAGGPSPIKVAEIGVNTFSRAGITSQINNNLGDPGIPSPNLVGEIKPEAVDALDAKTAELKKVRDEWKVKKEEYKAKKNAAKKAYQEARDKLPEGDPSIAGLKQAYDDAVAEFNYVDLKYDSADIAVTNNQFLKTTGIDVNAQAQAQVNALRGIV